MRALLAAFAIGALLWTTVGSGDAPVATGPEHRAAVLVDVSTGPDAAVGTARARQLRGAYGN